jgi:hypothetical protein
MLSGENERPLREQLIEARSKITAQLDELYLRTAPGGRGNALPPDYRAIIAELEGELSDIDELLGSAGKNEPD